MIPFRVGLGYDSHRLVEGRALILAGVTVPHTHGLFGHSDADVLLHAITDSICGAAGLPDIGMIFPNTDPRWKNADSGLMLQEVGHRARQEGWEIVNIDAILIAEKPKIAPYVPTMRENVASLLQLPVDCVNIRGKTAEGLGALGACEGMAAHAVCLAQRKPPEERTPTWAPD